MARRRHEGAASDGGAGGVAPFDGRADLVFGLCDSRELRRRPRPLLDGGRPGLPGDLRPQAVELQRRRLPGGPKGLRGVLRRRGSHRLRPRRVRRVKGLRAGGGRGGGGLRPPSTLRVGRRMERRGRSRHRRPSLHGELLALPGHVRLRAVGRHLRPDAGGLVLGASPGARRPRLLFEARARRPARRATGADQGRGQGRLLPRAPALRLRLRRGARPRPEPLPRRRQEGRDRILQRQNAHLRIPPRRPHRQVRRRRRRKRGLLHPRAPRLVLHGLHHRGVRRRHRSLEGEGPTLPRETDFCNPRLRPEQLRNRRSLRRALPGRPGHHQARLAALHPRHAPRRVPLRHRLHLHLHRAARRQGPRFPLRPGHRRQRYRRRDPLRRRLRPPRILHRRTRRHAPKRHPPLLPDPPRHAPRLRRVPPRRRHALHPRRQRLLHTLRRHRTRRRRLRQAPRTKQHILLPLTACPACLPACLPA
mmetsp:Transcript_131/g.471  ORF Transcript_131/g.471 Transcript_131/m.471 type:complete len:476 (+) Transcript_131:368-1795(+)